jgi:hypothetical protein
MYRVVATATLAICAVSIAACVFSSPALAGEGVDVYATSLENYVNSYTAQHGECTGSISEATSNYARALERELERTQMELESRCKSIPTLPQRLRRTHRAFLAFVDAWCPMVVVLQTADLRHPADIVLPPSLRRMAGKGAPSLPSDPGGRLRAGQVNWLLSISRG